MQIKRLKDKSGRMPLSEMKGRQCFSFGDSMLMPAEYVYAKTDECTENGCCKCMNVESQCLIPVNPKTLVRIRHFKPMEEIEVDDAKV